MKTVLSFAVTMFLATASFAQANVKSTTAAKNKTEVQRKHSTTAAQTSLQANANGEAHQNTALLNRQKRKTARAEKRSVTANQKGKLVSGVASQKSETKIEGKQKGALVSGIASEGKSKAGDVHSKEKTKSTATYDHDGTVKTKVKKIKKPNKKASSATTLHTTAATSHAVKMRPASVQTKAGVGVKIK